MVIIVLSVDLSQKLHSLIYSVFAYVYQDVYMDVSEACFIITKDWEQLKHPLETPLIQH